MSPTGPRMDGRLLRGERARAQVAAALLSLLEEGDVRPTAPRIAARAGVSLRTLFHHFTDLDSLFLEVARRQMERLADLIVPIPPHQPFAARLRQFTDQRSKLLEAISPVRRAALLHEPFNQALSASLAGTRMIKRSQAEHVFHQELMQVPEADRLEVRAALGVTASWSTWNELRACQGLSVEQARGVMARMIATVLGQTRAM